MELIEGVHGTDRTKGLAASEQLGCIPKDYRAEHCKTVEEYRLWRFSSNYQTSSGGDADVYNQCGIEVEHENECSI